MELFDVILGKKSGIVNKDTIPLRFSSILWLFCRYQKIILFPFLDEQVFPVNQHFSSNF